MIERSVVEVRNKHLVWATQGSLTSYGSRQAGLGENTTRRVFLRLIGVRFGRLLGESASINEFLRAALNNEAIPKTTMELLEREPDRRECQLFAACLFTATERWQTATEFAERALNLVSEEHNTGALFQEAAYLYALCLRLSLEREWQFNKAMRLLEDNIYSYRHDVQKGAVNTIRRLRDEVELGSLLVAAAVAQEIGRTDRRRSRARREQFFADDRISNLFHLGAARLRASLDELRDAEPFDFRLAPRDLDGKGGQNLIRSIELQALTNLCGAAVFEKLLVGLVQPNRIIGFSTEDHEVLSRQVEGEARVAKQFRHVDHIYLGAYGAITAVNLIDRQRAARFVLDVLGSIDENVVRLPHCDRIEFDFLRPRMAEIVGNVEGAA